MSCNNVSFPLCILKDSACSISSYIYHKQPSEIKSVVKHQLMSQFNPNSPMMPPDTIQSSQSHPKYFEMWFQSPRFLLKYPIKSGDPPISPKFPINIPYVFLDISHKTSRRTPKQSTNVPFTSMVFTIKTTSKIHWQDCCPDISHWYIILCHISHVYSKISSHISYIYIHHPTLLTKYIPNI